MCLGNKYEPILPHWMKRINEKCYSPQIIFLNNLTILDTTLFDLNKGGIIWAIRWKNFLDYIINSKEENVIMCDIDIIIEKNLEPLVALPYDIIWSTEIGGNKAYPQHCTKILGFGICAGFGIFKKSAIPFITTIFKNMQTYKYNSYDDQVNIMEYIVNTNHKIYEEKIILDDKTYTNKIIEIDDIKICVLDFNIIIRDPISNDGQFANHINIDNVGGPQNFIKYFYNDFKHLPLTCRCGKTWLGNNEKCTHIRCN
jgi:hypothetical protein